MSTSVWIISYNFYPVWAGPAERFARYSPLFKDLDIDVTFVTVQRPGLPSAENTSDYKILRFGPDSKTIDGDEFSKLCLFHLIQMPNPPKVIVNLAVSRWQILLLPLVHRRGVKSIYVSTMALTNTDDSGVAIDGWKARLIRIFMRMVLRAHSKVVTSTQWLRAELLSLGVKQTKTFVIPNGVNLDRFRQPSAGDKAAAKAELGIGGLGGPVFLFIGLIVKRKGVLRLLQVWRAFKASGGTGQLCIVGGEQREIQAFRDFYLEWDAEKAKLKPTDEVYFYPATKKVEVWYRASDAFIFLSELEGMPNVIPEAMASGLPIIVNRFAGFSEDFGRHEENLIIAEPSTTKLIEQMDRLAKDIQLRTTLGESARHWQITHNDFRKSAQSYAQLFGA